MNFAAAPKIEVPPEVDDVDSVVDSAIRRFLDGTSDGHALFEALYGAALDEPVPEHLLAIVRRR